MSPAKPKPKPPTYGKPEPRNWWGLIAFWVFMLVSFAAVGWLLSINTKQRPLVCERNNVSLLEFGTCHEE